MSQNKQLCLILTIFFLFAGALAAEAGPRVIAVELFADWCAECKLLAVNYNPIKKKYLGGGGGIKFITFDRSNKYSEEASRKLAARLGLTEIYNRYPHTGQVLIINANTKEVLGIFTKLESGYTMMDVLDKALRGESSMNMAKDTDKGMKGSMGDKGSMMQDSY